MEYTSTQGQKYEHFIVYYAYINPETRSLDQHHIFFNDKDSMSFFVKCERHNPLFCLFRIQRVSISEVSFFYEGV